MAIAAATAVFRPDQRTGRTAGAVDDSAMAATSGGVGGGVG
jgi:hypothetical protein